MLLTKEKKDNMIKEYGGTGQLTNREREREREKIEKNNICAVIINASADLVKDNEEEEKKDSRSIPCIIRQGLSALYSSFFSYKNN